MVCVAHSNVPHVPTCVAEQCIGYASNRNPYFDLISRSLALSCSLSIVPFSVSTCFCKLSTSASLGGREGEERRERGRGEKWRERRGREGGGEK